MSPETHSFPAPLIPSPESLLAQAVFLSPPSPALPFPPFIHRRPPPLPFCFPWEGPRYSPCCLGSSANRQAWREGKRREQPTISASKATPVIAFHPLWCPTLASLSLSLSLLLVAFSLWCFVFSRKCSRDVHRSSADDEQLLQVLRECSGVLRACDGDSPPPHRSHHDLCPRWLLSHPLPRFGSSVTHPRLRRNGCGRKATDLTTERSEQLLSRLKRWWQVLWPISSSVIRP